MRYYYPQSISRNENCAFEKICSKKAGISLTFHLCINANEAGLSKICVFAGYSFGWFECSFGKNKRRRKKGNGFDDLFILATLAAPRDHQGLESPEKNKWHGLYAWWHEVNDDEAGSHKNHAYLCLQIIHYWIWMVHNVAYRGSQFKQNVVT